MLKFVFEDPHHHSPPVFSTPLHPDPEPEIPDSPPQDFPASPCQSITPPLETTQAGHIQPATEECRTSTITPPPLPSITPTASSSGQTLFRPTYHIARPNRKIQDWFFKPRKPVLILGDSNINRIPAHTHPQIQLDSYPGANSYHFLKVCEKSIPNPKVKIVVFSIGINNKDQDPRQTTTKQLKTLFRQAKSTFPNADIYYPIMNFSSQLTDTQKGNLKLINNIMTTYAPFLTEIPHDTFTTEKDNIHWTPTTAKLIFENWIQQLNLQ